MIRFWLFLVLGISLSWAIGSPYYIAYQMKLAADANDSETLAGYVDFQALQANTKQKLNTAIAEQGKGKDPLLVALGRGLSQMLGDKMVETAITPEGLSQLLRGSHSIQVKTQVGQIEVDSEETQTQEASSDDDVEFGYKAWNKFAVDIKSNNSQSTRLVLSRQGLTWKLTDVQFVKI